MPPSGRPCPALVLHPYPQSKIQTNQTADSVFREGGILTVSAREGRCRVYLQIQRSCEPSTVQLAYMKRFRAAKTVPYIQKNHIREVDLYIYIL